MYTDIFCLPVAEDKDLFLVVAQLLLLLIMDVMKFRLFVMKLWYRDIYRKKYPGANAE